MYSFTSIIRDIRFALRLMRRSPAFTSVAILSMTLGIGATIAIFSVMYALILKPLPVFQPNRLVQVWRSDDAPFHSFPVWKQLQDHQGLFSDVTAYYPWDNHFNLDVGGQNRDLTGLYVSGSLFQTLGVSAIVGRTLTATDDQPGAAAVCVIGYGLWRSQYSQSPNVLGRMIVLNGHTFEVVGVAPQSFFGLEVGKRPELFLTLEMQRVFEDYQRWSNGNAKPRLGAGNALIIVGRLKPGTSVRQADAWLRVVGIDIYRSLSPGKYSRGTLSARPMPSGMSRSYFSGAVMMMMIMAGIALIAACANLGNLLLARAMRRQSEIAIRLALGATRRRLIRQLLIESIVISFAGTGGGLVLAHWATQLLLKVISFSGDLTVLDLTWDAKLVLFTVGIMMISALCFGLAPAIQASSIPLYTSMQTSSATASGRNRLSNAVLIVIQIALSLSLFDGAGLLVRTQHALLAKDPGFEPKGVVVAQVSLDSANNHPQQDALEANELLNRFRSVPGVISASWTANFSNSTPPEVTIPQAGGSERATRGYRIFVSPDFFKTRHTPLLAGREFDETDHESSIPVAVISKQAASVWFHGVNPIGLSFHENAVGSSEQRYAVRVVGIASNIDFQAPNYAPLPIFFRPTSQCSSCAPMGRYEIRFSGAVSDLPNRLKSSALSLDPNLTLEFRTLSEEIKAGIQQNNAAAWMGTLFGLFAGLLAMIGVYGVNSYAASLRTHEIGIRMALGAQRGVAFRMILGETTLAVIAGVALGIPTGLAAAGMVRSLLWGVAPNDVRTFIYSVCLIVFVAFVAAFLPARRAMQVNPMICLKYE